MKLPWKGSRLALVAAAAHDRRFSFFICCVTTLAAVFFALTTPQIIRFTIDSCLGDKPPQAYLAGIVQRLGGIEYVKNNVWICGLLTLATALLAGICHITRRYTSTEIGETVAWRMRNALYGHIQKLPFDWHVSCRTGDIIQRCTTDVDNIRNFIQNQLSELMRTSSVFIVALAMMFSMDVLMSLMAIAFIPLILAFSIVYFRRIGREFNRADEAEGVMQAAAQENYTGVRVVRAFGRESYEMDNYAEKTKTYQSIWIRIGKMLGLFWAAGDVFAGMQLALIVGAGVWRSVQGDISPGTFLAFYTYCNWMIWPVRQLGRILADLSKTMVAANRIREILAEKPEEDPPDALSPELKGSICFKNVTFGYGKSAEPVLRGISFNVNPGESMAILGITGSGKSTLVHLISRLYDLNIDEGAASGEITIDGIDIRKISRPHLRRHIGLCLQEPFLFSKTIGENIALGRSRLLSETMELVEIRSAAAVAMVDETIIGFAEGYNTVIGERGVTLSGGQKQRVAIARMLAGGAPIMIFDDSLSAVDTETDAKIRAALKKHSLDSASKAAVIIISHRISSLMQADKILVLINGEVEDIGSHEELLKRGGSYRRIYELQRGVEQNG